MVERMFLDKCGFPGVVAAIDGCHIKIHPPAKHQNSYRNYKKFHSIVLMATVLPDKRFSYIFTGFPGSSHDSYVFQRSSLYGFLDDPNECPTFLDSRRQHIVGDSAFPLKPWLQVPYKRDANAGLTPSQRIFNRKLSGTRVCVEQAFGDLQNRFRRLQDIHASVRKCVEFTVTACVIHKICIQNCDFCIDIP